jgi:hypothetical protein
MPTSLLYAGPSKFWANRPLPALPRQLTFHSGPYLDHASVRQLIKQRLGFFEVDGIESFCEPAVDRPEEIRRSGAVAASNPHSSPATLAGAGRRVTSQLTADAAADLRLNQ